MTLNKAMLIGRLGKDPEVRYTKGGDSVASFTLATDETWRDKQGNKQEKTEWHNIVAWGKLADFVQNYLKKGRLVYLEGRIETRDWTDAQNVKHWKTEINARTIRFVGPPPDGAGRGAPRGGDEEGYGPPQRQERAGSQGPGQGQGQGQGKSGPPAPGGQAPGPEGDYVEDDIPF